MSMLDSYKKLNGKKVQKIDSSIRAYIPNPTDVDYQRGFIRRFFAQKANDKSSAIIEISSDDYNRISRTPVYRTVTIRWRIKGPLQSVIGEGDTIIDKGVSNSNSIAISLVSNDMPNLKLYLPNLLQFYK